MTLEICLSKIEEDEENDRLCEFWFDMLAMVLSLTIIMRTRIARLLTGVYSNYRAGPMPTLLGFNFLF